MGNSTRVTRMVLLAILILAITLGVTACGSDPEPVDEPGVTNGSSTDDGSTGEEPAGEQADPARDLVEIKCSMCHTTERVYSAEKTREEWVVTIDRMKTNGLVITDEEYDTIVEYLSGS